MSCDVGEVTERLENELLSSPTSQIILQSFRRLTYVTAHSPTLPLLHLRHSSFSNPSFASPMSQALHLIPLASRPFRNWHFLLAIVMHWGCDMIFVYPYMLATNMYCKGYKVFYNTGFDCSRMVGSMRSLKTGCRIWKLERHFNIVRAPYHSLERSVQIPEPTKLTVVLSGFPIVT